MGPVVLLTTNLARGGAETQVALLALALLARGWTVHVVSLLDPSAFHDGLARQGVQVHSLGMTPGIPGPRGLARLASILRDVRPAVLHCHMFHANLLGRLARLLFPIPRVISTLHSLAESSRRSPDPRRRDLLYRLTDPLADSTVAVCQAAANRHAAALAVNPAKLRVIPNGVDTAAFKPDPARREAARRGLGVSDEFVWLAAGRLMWKKDYPAMIRAAALRPGRRLWIAGTGPQEAELRALASELRADVCFLGLRAGLPDLMNAADALVLSSTVEGLPMVLLEAAASGLPCVSTSAGGAGEVIADTQTGFLSPCGDPDSLAASMARMEALTSGERLAMGRAARALALERFDIGAVTSQWEKLYLEP
ncbi:MAG: glycosyl transferase family 1 [Candidatus Solibacter sp.]|nr:glycosyl transferase family 1 [Candidatus Solibacter sp.]